MRRKVAVVGMALALVVITASVVFALNYEGEDFCQDTPAWPSGTYLGQMHPYHSDFYTRYAEKRGWDVCETWATDQRNSAIRGLRELGYMVHEPGVAPPVQAPVVQVTPTPTLTSTPTPEPERRQVCTCKRYRKDGQCDQRYIPPQTCRWVPA